MVRNRCIEVRRPKNSTLQSAQRQYRMTAAWRTETGLCQASLSMPVEANPHDAQRRRGDEGGENVTHDHGQVAVRFCPPWHVSREAVHAGQIRLQRRHLQRTHVMLQWAPMLLQIALWWPVFLAIYPSLCMR